ncbi:MAG: ATP-binding protein [Bacilli bacterium]|nr:ATP-binding protein [Bacilli bacterium]
MSSLYFQVCAFFIWVLITIVYFSKQRVKSLETRIYSYLLFITFFSLFFDITIIVLTYLEPIEYLPVIKVLNKFYFSSILMWILMLCKYVVNISYDLEVNNKKLYKKLDKINFLLYITFVIIIFILPVYIYNENGIMYSYGESLNFLLISAGIYALIIVGCVVLKFRTLKNKKYMPVFILIILIALNFIVNRVSPDLLLTTPIMTYIVLIMYHTIENPDMKLINELNIAKSQADKANNAKSDFLSNMSHEIRTPLNAIVGFSQALKEDDDLPESSKSEVNDIIMASNGLLEIVNGILDFSKIEAGKLEIINKEYYFAQLWNDLISLTKARLGDKPLDLQVKYDESIPKVLYGDSARIKQVILNILTNSIKYTKEGYVDFRVSSFIKNDICRLIISVEDSGIGIKAEKIENLFTKFQRLDEDKNATIEGTGLGLAITKKLLDLMNGQITVQSKYGEGSKFTVIIDQKIVHNPTITNVVNNPKIENDITFEGKRILVVDDNKINLKVAIRLLRSYKVIVDLVESGQECIDKVVEGVKYDLILLDDMMPKISGIETLKKLKKIEGFNIPTIAFTANAITGVKEKYLEEGFDDYLSKPMQKSELTEILQKFINNN